MKLHQFLLSFSLMFSLVSEAQNEPMETKMQQPLRIIEDSIEIQRQKVDSLKRDLEIEQRFTDHILDSLRAENERLKWIMRRSLEQIDSLNAIKQEEERTGRYKIAETTSEYTGGYVRLYRLNNAKLSCEELNIIEVEVEHHKEGDITILGTGMSMSRLEPFIFQVQLNCASDEYKLSVFLNNVDGTKTNIARFHLYRNSR